MSCCTGYGVYSVHCTFHPMTTVQGKVVPGSLIYREPEMKMVSTAKCSRYRLCKEMILYIVHVVHFTLYVVHYTLYTIVNIIQYIIQVVENRTHLTVFLDRNIYIHTYIYVCVCVCVCVLYMRMHVHVCTFVYTSVNQYADFGRFVWMVEAYVGQVWRNSAQIIYIYVCVFVCMCVSV